MRLPPRFNQPKNYTQPERFTPAEARERRLATLLERERRFQDLPNFTLVREQLRTKVQREPPPLSQANLKKLSFSYSELVKDRQRYGPKARSILAALAMFGERDFDNPEARAAYRKIRNLQSRNWRNVQLGVADNRQHNPTGRTASTVSGTLARLMGVRDAMDVASSSWLPRFKRPEFVVPCIQRTRRREIMFAKGKAGRGYHTPKRRNIFSGIPC